MNEIKIQELEKFKNNELEFTVGSIFKDESGQITAHLHFPKHSQLGEELGEVFVAQVGDEFKFGKHIYIIDKIVENSQIDIKGNYLLIKTRNEI